MTDFDLLQSGPGVYELPNKAYQAEPVSLSVSGARLLLPPSCPALYRHEKEHPTYRAAWDVGSAAHKLVLGDDSVEIVVVDADSWRTKAAQQAQREARESGKVPILAADYATVQAMAAKLREHPVASALLRPGAGVLERSLFWSDDGHEVWRRARPDWMTRLPSGRFVVVDYKTAVSANPETFGQKAADFGYHQQHAWYLDGVRALGLDDDPAFLFVVQEKTPPYLVSVLELDDEAVRVGSMLNGWAMDVYAECVAINTWPGYSSDVESVSLPYYYVRRFQEELVA